MDYRAGHSCGRRYEFIENLQIDDRVELREEKEKTVAYIRYSGTWRKKRYEDHAQKLMDWISTMGWTVDGAPVWARYNPPFMPWFMRRNEILILVKSR
jgi:hypothetical protein